MSHSIHFTDLSLLGHTPEVGIPSRLVTHLPSATVYVAERQRGLLGIVQRDLHEDSNCDINLPATFPRGRYPTLTDTLCDHRASRPLPRCLVLHIACSGSIACDERKSSTSCLERSWLGNRLRTPSPEEQKTPFIHQDWKEGKQEERHTNEHWCVGFLPHSGWVLLHSSDPRTSPPPTPSCGKAARNCGAAEDSSRSRRSTASGR